MLGFYKKWLVLCKKSLVLCNKRLVSCKKSLTAYTTDLALLCPLVAPRASVIVWEVFTTEYQPAWAVPGPSDDLLLMSQPPKMSKEPTNSKY